MAERRLVKTSDIEIVSLVESQTADKARKRDPGDLAESVARGMRKRREWEKLKSSKKKSQSR